MDNLASSTFQIHSSLETLLRIMLDNLNRMTDQTLFVSPNILRRTLAYLESQVPLQQHCLVIHVVIYSAKRADNTHCTDPPFSSPCSRTSDPVRSCGVMKMDDWETFSTAPCGQLSLDTAGVSAKPLAGNVFDHVTVSMRS